MRPSGGCTRARPPTTWRCSIVARSACGPASPRLLGEARAAGVRLAIATTTTPDNVTRLLSTTLGAGADGWFDVIGAGDVVPCKKPAPDIYRWVLDRLGLPPTQCLAIEDSAAGARRRHVGRAAAAGHAQPLHRRRADSGRARRPGRSRRTGSAGIGERRRVPMVGYLRPADTVRVASRRGNGVAAERSRGLGDRWNWHRKHQVVTKCRAVPHHFGGSCGPHLLTSEVSGDPRSPASAPSPPPCRVSDPVPLWTPNAAGRGRAAVRRHRGDAPRRRLRLIWIRELHRVPLVHGGRPGGFPQPRVAQWPEP